MKDSRTPWVTLLRLVLALSDAIVLEQIELLDFQKSQRLCMYLCVMDLNGYSMIWDPQWFDSLGHFLPSHRYAFCALPSFLLSILMPFTLPFRPHYLCPAGWSTGSMSEERRTGRARGGQNCRSGKRRSRAQGLKVLRSDLWWRKEPAQVEWNIVQHYSLRFATETLESAVQQKGIKVLLLLSWVLFLFLVEHLDMNAGIWLRKFFALFLFLFIYLVLYLPFRSVLEQRTAALPSTYQFWSILLNQGGFVSHPFPPSFSHKEAEAEEARELERNTLNSFKEERSMTVVSIICCWHCHQLKNLVKPGEVCVIPHPSPTR